MAKCGWWNTSQVRYPFYTPVNIPICWWYIPVVTRLKCLAWLPEIPAAARQIASCDTAQGLQCFGKCLTMDTMRGGYGSVNNSFEAIRNLDAFGTKCWCKRYLWSLIWSRPSSRRTSNQSYRKRTARLGKSFCSIHLWACAEDGLMLGLHKKCRNSQEWTTPHRGFHKWGYPKMDGL